MQPILIVGTILMTGFIFGEIASKVKLPKVTGYILAGIFLNPDLFGFIPRGFIAHTDLIANIALSFITFSVGGTLFIPEIRKLGRSIFSITIGEAEGAFFAVALGFMAVAPRFVHLPQATWAATFIPVSLLLAALASPTDPSATLAVTHEYRAKGVVTSTIMGVAAFDDGLGIMNYSVAVIIARSLISHQAMNVHSLLLGPLLVIGGAALLGSGFGYVFNRISSFVDRESEGVLIVVILALLTLCFGAATALGVDELIATMAMGAVVVNKNGHRRKIFQILERYTDELVFVVFFTLSGMHLDFGLFLKSVWLVLFFVLFRAVGKFGGTWASGAVSHAQPAIRKYTAGGLIPQGGIVVGLALMMQQIPEFSAFSPFIINIVIGATVIHELIGPLCAKITLIKAGEITG